MFMVTGFTPTQFPKPCFGCSLVLIDVKPGNSGLAAVCWREPSEPASQAAVRYHYGVTTGPVLT